MKNEGFIRSVMFIGGALAASVVMTVFAIGGREQGNERLSPKCVEGGDDRGITREELEKFRSDLGVDIARILGSTATKSVGDTDDIAKLNERVTECLSRIDEIREKVSILSFGFENDTSSIPRQTSAIRELAVKLSADPKLKSTAAFGWPLSVAYSKFGKPDMVMTSGPNEVWWNYWVDDAHALRFVAIGGVVDRVDVANCPNPGK